ncbi:hypothetical protein N39L_39440 [Limnospira platensis NIES-39]|uniref:Uncharacterized protein n=1 Tax=Limnospira platensis NIES-46 TaxID=1236695 RepID=A0A5M3T3R8_LIMPL|nr:hypothetical protein N39L_39440 [Arthrospira platensis NIES-39]GCE92149.1 hypothetical protein NIES46_01840 [Arthrospira platensis NIES-46]
MGLEVNTKPLSVFCVPLPGISYNTHYPPTLSLAMNEQRIAAYLSLIQELLECTGGEEPQILNGHLEGKS